MRLCRRPPFRAQSMPARQPVHGRFGREVKPFIGKLRNELLRRQADVTRTGQHAYHPSLLSGRQRMAWRVAGSATPIADLRIRSPALDGPSRDPEQVTSSCQTRA